MTYVWYALGAASLLVGCGAAWRATRGRDAVIAAAGGSGFILAMGLVNLSRGLGFNWAAVLLQGTAVAFTLGSFARGKPGEWYPGWMWPAAEGFLGAAAFIAMPSSVSLGLVFLGAGGLVLAAELLVSARVRR